MADELIQKHIRSAKDGLMFEAILQYPGWTEVFYPRLLALLEEADKKCHSTSSPVETLKVRLGHYAGLQDVVDLCKRILNAKDSAMKILSDRGIEIR